MVFYLNRRAQRLTAKQITAIFKAADECYQFRLDPTQMERAILYLTGPGRRLLKNRQGIDFRPWMGSKFFIEPCGSSTRIWAYSSDKPQKAEYREFNRRLEEMFS